MARRLADPEEAKKIRDRMAGENSPVAKYNWDTIRAIRAEYDAAKGRRGIQRELVKKYNVNAATMSGIVNRKIWIDHDG
jgi:hypothetical protein